MKATTIPKETTGYRRIYPSAPRHTRERRQGTVRGPAPAGRADHHCTRRATRAIHPQNAARPGSGLPTSCALIELEWLIHCSRLKLALQSLAGRIRALDPRDRRIGQPPQATCGARRSAHNSPPRRENRPDACPNCWSPRVRTSSCLHRGRPHSLTSALPIQSQPPLEKRRVIGSTWVVTALQTPPCI